MRISRTWILLLACNPVTAQRAKVGPRRPASVHDVEQLQSIVLPDLRDALSRAYNSGYSEADTTEEYKHCLFEYVSLGSLGIGVRVVWNGSPAPNSPLTALYLKEGSTFHRLYTGTGFGPDVIVGRSIPDLVVGRTNGVCTERLTRLRLGGAVYKPDACIQHVPKSNGDCGIVRCEGSLPTFPDPYALHP